MKIIAKQHSSKAKPFLGEVLPIWVKSENGWYRATEEMFPNDGKVFVRSGYDQHVSNVYEDPDLFYVEDIEESVNPVINDDDSKYVSPGENIKPIEKVVCCRVYNRKFNLDEPIPIVRNYYPIKNYVFVRNIENNKMYGPFSNTHYKSEDGAINNKLIAPNYAELDLPYEYNNCIFEFEINDSFDKHTFSVENYIYIFDAIKLLKDESVNRRPHYYGNVKELLDWAKNRLEVDAEAITKLTKSLSTFDVKDATEAIKLDKLKELLGKEKAWTSKNLFKFVSYYLKEDEQGRNMLQDYLKENSNDLQDKFNNELTLLKNELEAKKKEISSTSKDNRLEQLEEGEKKFIDRILENKSTLVGLMEIDTYNEKIAELRGEMRVHAEQAKLRKNELDSEINEKADQLSKLDASLDALRKEFKDEGYVRNNLLKAKPYIDLLNGVVPFDESNTSLVRKYNKLISLRNETPSIRTFLQETQENLKKLGRNIEYNELANYLITINQNFFTIFAGLPGVGKTSLVTKLADSVGLKNRFLPISTSRGWTSSKDLIGYFNPLSNKFQASKTRLFGALATCHNNLDNGVDVPYWIMLDEANLSPIEYYWSDFMRLCDPEANRSISLPSQENDEIVNIGQGLRFIGTINYDHTTEILSPRLLDRIAVIILNEPENISEIKDYESIVNIDSYFTVQQINDMFNPLNVSYKFTDDEQNLFEAIKGIFEDNVSSVPIVISPRKQRDVIKYCTIARQVFSEGGSQFEPLDYAITQYIMPLVNGRGEYFARKINSLMDKTQTSLPKTTATLDKILKMGELNYQTYRFFS